MKKVLTLVLVVSMLLAFMAPLASASTEPPPQYGRVRNIKTPAAGQYPTGFYRNTVLDYNFNHAASGMTQSLSWSPQIDDRGFLPNTVYTAVLELEPISGTAWTGAGFPNPANFSANSITWENMRNLPPMEDIRSIRSEYFSGPASGNYFAIDALGGGPNTARNTAADPAGANLRIFIEFKPTGPTVLPPEVIYYDDFNGPTKVGTGTGVGSAPAYAGGLTTHWARGSQQTRQSNSYWLNDLAYIEPSMDDPDDNVLVLGWRQNTGRSANGSATQNVRPAVPPTAYNSSRNAEGNCTLQILLDIAILDFAWMGGNYLADPLGVTAVEWAALSAADKLAAWNALTVEERTVIWDGFWPVRWTNSNTFSRDNYKDAGCVDTRVGGEAGPFSWSYGYYEVGIRMTPINGVWTAFWLNGEGSGGNYHFNGLSDTTITDINRVDSANPVLARPGSPYHRPEYYGRNPGTFATLTAAQMLSAAQRQASWHSCEVDVIENCEQVMESGYSTGLHFGGYSGYGTGQQHQEAWMPFDVSDYGVEQAARLNIFDGEIHRLGYEWSPGNVKFFLDDDLCAQATDDATHYTLFDASKDQVPRLPTLDGRLGVPQNPVVMRLSVEGSIWTGHGNEYEHYPYRCGLGLMTPTNHRFFDDNDPYRRLLEGTQANGGAAVISYVSVVNGPRPDKSYMPVEASISAEEEVVVVDKPVDVFVALNYMNDVNLVELEFTFDSAFLDIKGVSALKALGGFSILDASVESYYGSSLYKGKVTLMYPGGFITCREATDILQISGAAKGNIGDTAVTLDSIIVVGKNASGKAAEWNTKIIAGAAEIAIVNWTKVFSVYDLNKGPLNSDGTISIVDAIDLSIAVNFYQMRDTDADWETAGYNNCTAKEADVNKSGVVNLADLIEIMANYGPYSVFPG